MKRRTVWKCDSCGNSPVIVVVITVDDQDPEVKLQCEHCMDTWEVQDIEAIVTDEGLDGEQ